MNLFESYLEEFSQSIDLTDFLLNMVVAALMCTILRWFYVRYGQAISNRKRFANTFLPLGLTTLLIITIVKSSIALSLGLVGALSIVRFRAAIKDPEELTYLFLSIAIGLAAGASKVVIALIAFVFILGILFLRHRLGGYQPLRKEEYMFLNIRTELNELPQVSDALSQIFPYVELKRMDTQGEGLTPLFSHQVRLRQRCGSGTQSFACPGSGYDNIHG
jgi:multisubunit Na+/H+ antiporter MnhE subunit